MNRDKRFFVICLIAATIILLGAVVLRVAMDGRLGMLEDKTFSVPVVTLFPTSLPNQPNRITPTVTLVPVPEGGLEYIVESGDTLTGIALRFGVNMQEIVRVNQIANIEMIDKGMRLVIPRQAVLTFAPTPSRTPNGRALTYTVLENDTLSDIASQYHVSVDALMSANGITDPNMLQIGQILVIPSADGSNVPAPTVIATYPFSAMEGNVALAYPLVTQGAGFRVHYQRGSLAEHEINDVTQFVPIALAHINTTLSVSFTQMLDVYLADTLFAPPDQALGGKADSANKRLFVQYSSQGRAWRHYLLAHELTHVVAWNTYGAPASAMLSEGLAVYVAERFLLEESNMTVLQMCRAWQSADALPDVASPSLALHGHAASLDAYFAAGCFVDYLVNHFGMDAVKKNYSQPALQISGKNVVELARQSRIDLAQMGKSITEPPLTVAIVVAYNKLRNDYKTLWSEAGASRQVDKAKLRELDKNWLTMLLKK